jgi:uncharacterized YigZ family protein
MFRLAHEGHAEETINKSRFIAKASYCETESAVLQSLNQMAVLHQSASHLPYAFRIKTPQGVIQRFSDAGEPSGTAGKPILQFLEGRNLINVCVGVIRYYGGINLGTGGLARAYGGTAKLALENAGLIPYVEMQTIQLVLAYQELDYVLREVEKNKGTVVNKTFTEEVRLNVQLPIDAIPAFNRFQR